jgi:phosphopantothenate---cysteine ligase (ATP)
MTMTEKQPSSDILPDESDYTNLIEKHEVIDLKQRLTHFIDRQQQVYVRPICLVSSGGTAVDLELNAVRCLDNFSTGLRGAISVEEFLRRGYAVIHLQREGSTSPYARVLNQQLGLKQSNYSLTTECLGKLFVNTGEVDEDDLLQSVLSEEKESGKANDDKNVPDADLMEIKLHRTIINSSTIRKALKERSDVLREGRLITISFRTVEEYLAKLQICAVALSTLRSLATFYLAAAVSDFYVPFDDKAIHKIQSGSSESGLMLQLKPVPKVLGMLQRSWAPDAFLVSFKLETDVDILTRSQYVRLRSMDVTW